MIITNGGYIGINTTNPQGILDIENGTTGTTSTWGNMILNGGGNVGIGTNNPQGYLDVESSFFGNILFNGGNVGIGTTAPASPLEVNGEVSIGYPGIGAPFYGGLIVSGNVGIGTSNPQSVLEVNGNVSVGYPGISGPWYGGMIISGNVGIGTTSPAGLLDVEGPSWNQIILNAGRVGIGTTSPGAELNVVDSSGNGNAGIVIGTANPVGAFALDVEGFRNIVLNSGYVGIGTESPQNALDINGAASIGYNVPPSGGGISLIVSGNVGIGTTSTHSNSKFDVWGRSYASTSNGVVYLSTDSGNFGYLQAANAADSSPQTLVLQYWGGSVGIGTVAPQSMLDVYGGVISEEQNSIAATSTDGILLANNTAATAGTVGQFSPRIRFHSSEWDGSANHTIDWKEEVQTYLNEGLLTFAYSYDGGAYQTALYLDNFGYTNTKGLIATGNSEFISNWQTVVPLTVYGASSQTADLTDWQDSFGGTVVGSMDYAGNLTVVTVSQTSDERAKKNVVTIDTAKALGELVRLRPVAFDWKKTSHGDMGLVAQEVEHVYPQLVRHNKDGSLALEYTALTGPIIASVQELKARSDKLAADNASLRQQLETLTKGIRSGSSSTVTSCGLGQANGEGTTRYNYTSHHMEYCNGTKWVQM
jgi:hypothetical protein